jgi:hypothetical protein
MTNGLVVMAPSSITYSGTSASINADGSVVFSDVTSLSLNSVFTADYDNYMIAVRGSMSNTNRTFQYRLRSGTTDENSASNYYTYQSLSVQDTVVGAARTAATFGRFNSMGHGDGNQKSGCACYIFGPYLTQPTASRGVGASNYSTMPSVSLIDYATTHSLSNSYNGITVFPSSSSFTGLLTVFGFNQ